MIRRSFRTIFCDLTLVASSILVMSGAAIAQTSDPYLNQMLQETNQLIQESQDLMNQVEAQQQQEEANLSYGCYVLNDDRYCDALSEFYQRQTNAYEAGIEYYRNLQNSGWADSFGY